MRPQRQAWFLFFATGLAFGLGMLLFGFAHPRDAAKAIFWWFTISASAMAVSVLCISTTTARWLWFSLCAIFGFDAAAQGVIRGFMGTSRKPNLIAEVVANTDFPEILSFIFSQQIPILKGAVFFAAAIAIGLWGRAFWLKTPIRPTPPSGSQRLKYAGTVLLTTLTIAIHFNPGMLWAQPVARWVLVAHHYEQAQQNMTRLREVHDKIWEDRKHWALKSTDLSPRTVVIFLGESANASNWGLWGYKRDTTAPLSQAFAKLPGQVTLFTNAQSQEAFTLTSLRLALTPATQTNPNLWASTPDITQQAKAAGYRVTWISSQPKRASWLDVMGSQADEAHFINPGTWLKRHSTDEDLVPVLSKSLSSNTSATRELIVVHLQGQHFLYSERCPANVAPFSGDNDAIMESMKADGRTADIREKRNEYDNATYCGAQALAQMLEQIHKTRPARKIYALYFSDHGEEVGHYRNFAGHSDQDPSGYNIPVWLWHRDATYPTRPGTVVRNNTPLRLEHMDQGIAALLAVRTRWTNPALNPFKKPAT